MDDLALALALADRADELTLKHFRSTELDVQVKPDRSYVTEADIATERALRELIAAERPADGVLGEEFAELEGAGRRWILDPIDCTSNFVRGIEVYATLIALEVDGEITVGVTSSPAMGRRWWGARGQGAFTGDGRRMRVSEVTELADAVVSTTAPHLWDELGRLEAITGIVGAARAGFGDACFWEHMLVAEGRIDACLGPWGKVWDNAPAIVIVEEAGGRFTDLTGARRIDQDCGLVTNGLLHEGLLERLAESP